MDGSEWGIGEVRRLEIGPWSVVVGVDAGPRVLDFTIRGGPRLFAELPHAVIDHPTHGGYRFLGGHRLWRAPEVPSVTYARDDHPVDIRRHGDRVAVTGRPDHDGVVKHLELWCAPGGLVVDHVLENAGDRDLMLAPWAITQLRSGGTAVLPQPLAPDDPDGLLPNRELVLWPYSDATHGGVVIGREAVEISGDRSPPFKIGQRNARGWSAYVLGDAAFVKWSARHDAGADYADMGASVQVYRNDAFVELESLGRMVTAAPGGATSHREAWRLVELGGADWRDVLRDLPESIDEVVS